MNASPPTQLPLQNKANREQTKGSKWTETLLILYSPIHSDVLSHIYTLTADVQNAKSQLP